MSTPPRILVQIWSDFVCPFCAIGKQNFLSALERFEHPDQVRTEWKSFQLDPSASTESRKSIYEALAVKYGRTLPEAKAMCDSMSERAAEVGLEFRFDQVTPTGTQDAHRLFQWAVSKGCQDPFVDRLFKAYLTEGKHIGRREVLVTLAADAGLDPEEAEKILNSDAFATAVEGDQSEAQSMEVRGVPFFLINRKFAVSGAQPIEVFERALQTAWAEGANTHSTAGT